MKVSEKSVVVDSLKLFNRLKMISDREHTIQKSLQYELTQLPLSLFDNKQKIRKPNKAALGKYLKEMVVVQECSTDASLVVDGGWLSL